MQLRTYKHFDAQRLILFFKQAVSISIPKRTKETTHPTESTRERARLGVPLHTGREKRAECTKFKTEKSKKEAKNQQTPVYSYIGLKGQTGERYKEFYYKNTLWWMTRHSESQSKKALRLRLCCFPRFAGRLYIHRHPRPVPRWALQQ